MGGFGLDFTVYVDIPIDDFNGITWACDESFDEINPGTSRVFEDNDVPNLWIDELVNIFQDHNAVAVADASFEFCVGMMAAEQALGCPVRAEAVSNQ